VLVLALREKLGAAAQVGLNGIELFENNLVSYPNTPARMASQYGQLLLAGLIG
jgi:hypothetical protein